MENEHILRAPGVKWWGCSLETGPVTPGCQEVPISAHIQLTGDQMNESGCSRLGYRIDQFPAALPTPPPCHPAPSIRAGVFWTHLRIVKYWSSSPTPRDPNLIGLGCGPGARDLKLLRWYWCRATVEKCCFFLSFLFFANKVLLACSYPHLHITCGCFPATMAALSACGRPLNNRLQGPNLFTIRSFYRKHGWTCSGEKNLRTTFSIVWKKNLRRILFFCSR